MQDHRSNNQAGNRLYHSIAYEIGCRMLEGPRLPNPLARCRWRPRSGSACGAGIDRLRARAGGREKLYRLALAELAAARVEETMRLLLLLIDSERPYAPALLLGGLLAWVEGETWMAENCLDSYVRALPHNDIGWLMIETVYAHGDPVGLLVRAAGADHRQERESRHTVRAHHVVAERWRPGGPNAE